MLACACRPPVQLAFLLITSPNSFSIWYTFRTTALDSTLALLREGYTFLPNRRHRYQSDILGLRSLGPPAVCLSGAEGAELF